MRRLPPLQSLLAFEAAARLGNFSRAADELALTQSAISHQIQSLEAWVKQPLFRRIGRGVKLTGAGEVFLQTVAETIKLLAAGRNRIEPYRNLASVLLACPRSIAAGWLMRRLPALQALDPKLEFWLITTGEMREFDRIDVDLIISDRPIAGPDIVTVPFLEERAIAVCGPELARTLADLPFPEVLLAAPLIHDETRPGWAPWLPDLVHDGLAPRRGPTLDEPGLLIGAAQREMGIAMVSNLQAEDALDRGSIVALPRIPGFMLATHHLMKARGAPRTQAAEHAFDWLLAAAGDSA
jgi:LysR family glycine cleavage system transcriptional activator